jgi:glycosyltransferase involved in cell wall biosynthesis
MGTSVAFDIMMPFYGRLDHFKAAVGSVLAQTDTDWRLIVVDDVNPDLTPGEWLVSLGDPRITYIRNETNLKPSRNYRKAASLMSSEFSMLMGCDDVMLPGFLGHVKTLVATHPDVDVVQVGVEPIDAEGQRHFPMADRMKSWIRPGGPYPRVLEGPDLAKSLLRGNWTYFPSLVWRVSEIQNPGFRIDLDVVQDLDMLLQITVRGGRLLLDDRVEFQYRRHTQSYSAITGPDGSKFAQERTVFTEAAEATAALGWTGAARAARSHISSRLHAMTELPAAVKARNPIGVRALLRHATGSTMNRAEETRSGHAPVPDQHAR